MLMMNSCVQIVLQIVVKNCSINKIVKFVIKLNLIIYKLWEFVHLKVDQRIRKNLNYNH